MRDQKKKRFIFFKIPNPSGKLDEMMEGKSLEAGTLGGITAAKAPNHSHSPIPNPLPASQGNTLHQRLLPALTAHLPLEGGRFPLHWLASLLAEMRKAGSRNPPERTLRKTSLGLSSQRRQQTSSWF